MPYDDSEMLTAIRTARFRTWSKENIEARRAYQKAYRAKHREKLNEQRRTHPPKDPAARAAYMKKYAQNHREAVAEYKRRYREKNRDKLREANRVYVKTAASYREVSRRKTLQWRQDLEAMAGRPRPKVCDACGGPPDAKRPLHYDHCHSKGHFRGWICRECNLALGNVRDDANRLRKLIAYLKRTKDGPVAQFALPGV